MSKVLIATVKPFDAQATQQMQDIFSAAGHETVLLEKYADTAALLAAVKDAEALVVRSDKITPEVIAAAPQLKIVVRAGAGFDTIDLAAATAHNVVVENTPGQNSNAVAELAIGMMLFQTRNHFNGTAGCELKGKTLGIHGLGNVGKAIARIANGLEMEVYSYDYRNRPRYCEKHGAAAVNSVESLYSKVQIVSLNIPADENTIQSINYQLLSRLPDNGMLVNTARKEIIHEGDLLRIFAEKPDFQYVSDVAPDCKDELLEKYPERVFFTPKKMGAQTLEANVNAGVAAANQIVAYFKDGVTTFQVND
ncbi:MAG: NAD(P)-dependent oxidoreductase [Anaerolineae bacterium]|jgi:D-3-phosphoglycerate dehydrogenase|nr:NAD(P)-dependent oxidoreductase [Anaerolineae bacterium]